MQYSTVLVHKLISREISRENEILYVYQISNAQYLQCKYLWVQSVSPFGKMRYVEDPIWYTTG